MEKYHFLIDGFNLYHSIVDVNNLTKKNCKWLDIKSLCASYLPLFSKGAQITSIHYFSAYAHHTGKKKFDQDKKPILQNHTVDRHSTYVQSLENSGVTTHLHRFKSKIRK